jgi:hypothetical protein
MFSPGSIFPIPVPDLERKALAWIESKKIDVINRCSVILGPVSPSSQGELFSNTRVPVVRGP